jgi:restriction system protein
VRGAPTFPDRCRSCVAEADADRRKALKLAAEAKAEAARKEAEEANEAKRHREELLSRKTEFIRNVRTLTFLQSLDPELFQRLVWKVYSSLGYDVVETPMGKDGGVDGVLCKNGSRSILQCKRYQADVGEPVVRDLFGTVHHHGAQAGILVTTGKISTPARRFASGKPLTLVDGKALLSLLDAARLTEDVVPDEFVLRRGSPPQVLQPAKGRQKLCPLCGGKLVRRTGRHGGFLGCSAYPACRYTLGIAGR